MTGRVGYLYVVLFTHLLSLGALALWLPGAEPDAHRMPLVDVPVGLMGPTGAVQLHPLRQALVDVSARTQVAAPWVRVERATANVWNSETPILLGKGRIVRHTADLQHETLVADVGIPLGRWFATGVRVGGARAWGGGLVDEGIEAFHRQFEFYNFFRERRDQRRTLFVVDAPGGGRLDIRSPTAWVQSPQASFFVRVLENRTTQLMLRATLQAPLGDVARALRLQAGDVAVGGSIFRSIRHVAAVHLSGHVLVHGATRVGGLPLNSPRALLEGGLEVRLTPRLSLLIEDRLQSPLFHRTGRLLPTGVGPRATAQNAYYSPVNIITGGARVYLPGNSALTMHVGEDFMVCVECWKNRFSRETNAPDVSLSLTLEQVMPAGTR